MSRRSERAEQNRREYEAYHEAQISTWFSECVVVAEGTRTSVAEVQASFREWRAKHNAPAPSQILFNAVLEARGGVRLAARHQGRVRKVWFNIQLR